MFRHAARVNLARVVRAVADATTRPDTLPENRAALGINPTAAARAQAAFDAVWSRLQGAINDLRKDRSLSPDQRAAAVRALRERQALEAGATRKRIMDEEHAAARVRRRMRPRKPRKPHR